MQNNPLFTTLDVALNYQKKGFSIFPLWNGTKDKPLVSWKKYMYEKASEDEIRNWWAKYPNANIAIVTGKISGFFVLDTEKDFDLTSIEVPKFTPTVKTGSGGRHFYFKIPDGEEVGTHIEIWGKDIKSKADIKSNGGYVVAPPSFNQEKNSYYEWLVRLDELSLPPDWLMTAIDTLTVSKNSKPLHELANGVQEGSRNVSASSFIGHVLLKTEIDMWEMVAWPAIKSWNLKNEPPINEAELRTTFDSIASREFRRRNGQVTVDDLKDYDGPDKVVESIDLRNRLSIEKQIEDKIYLIPDENPMNRFPLDRLCDGYVPGELYIMSGPEKMGKTSFLEFMTTKFSVQDIPVLWFTYEMTPREFLKRFKDLPVFYLPMMNKSYDLQWLEKRVVEGKKKFGVRIIMIDHLGFILDAVQSNNLAVQLGTVVRFLKSIAREQDVVIFLVHHIKKLETAIEDGGQPTARDLRDSGLVAAEADSTIMIWRPLKYKKKKGEDAVYADEAMIKVCNNRRTGTMEKAFRARFDLETRSFIEIEGKVDVKTSSLSDVMDKGLGSK